MLVTRVYIYIPFSDDHDIIMALVENILSFEGKLILERVHLPW